jgi:DNA-directed RNA polymerase specialized sigma24 family protein
MPIVTNAEQDRALAVLKDLTDRIADHQSGIADLSQKRKDAILEAREIRCTYRAIAAAMGLAEQTVYKIVREMRDEAAVEDSSAA